jgi:hypothetical protein
LALFLRALLPLDPREPKSERNQPHTSLLHRGQNQREKATVHAIDANRKITTVTKRSRTMRISVKILGSPRRGKMMKRNMRVRTPRMDRGTKLRQSPSHRPKLTK